VDVLQLKWLQTPTWCLRRILLKDSKTLWKFRTCKGFFLYTKALYKKLYRLNIFSLASKSFQQSSFLNQNRSSNSSLFSLAIGQPGQLSAIFLSKIRVRIS
jgi:hypothetical protein